MLLSPSSPADLVRTRTRGAAVSGRRSVHESDPAFLSPAGRSADDPRDKWVDELPRTIADIAGKASNGRRSPFWSVRVVYFNQEIWVGSRDGEVGHDIRRACRLELRVQVDPDRPASASEDLVLPSIGVEGLRSSLAGAFDRAFDRAEVRRAATGPPAHGVTAAVFAPGAAGVVAHELIGHALEGDTVARGESWIGDPELVARRSLRVIDNPPKGRGAWVTDDEGVPSTETILVENGRATGVLLDKRSAGSLGRRSTGHGRRSSYIEPIRPRMGCTFIDAGEDDPAETIRSTQSGVFVRRLAGGHTDTRTGRSTFVVSDADRITAGRIAGPCDAFILELNGVQAWTSIDRVAHDLAFDTCIGSCVRDGQPLAVSVGAPTIRIGVVTVRS